MPYIGRCLRLSYRHLEVTARSLLPVWLLFFFFHVASELKTTLWYITATKRCGANRQKKVTKKLKYESDAAREDPTEANIFPVHPTMSNNVLIEPHQRTISSDHHRVHEKCICCERKGGLRYNASNN